MSKPDSPLLNTPDLWRVEFPCPAPDAHKYTRGCLSVIGGTIMTGAARLSARAGSRVGAGVTMIVSLPETLSVYQQAEPHLVIISIPSYLALPDLLKDDRKNAFVIGPGFGRDHNEDLRAFVRAALVAGRCVVLDGDGLTAFAERSTDLGGYVSDKLVITPHEGEFRTLFPDLSGARPEQALLAAMRTHAVVIYKGPETVIASPDGRMVVNTDAPATLSTAGTGDVLSGMIGGLMAQGMSAFPAACAAVWMHAEAARRFGPGLVATDLPDLLPGVLADLT